MRFVKKWVERSHLDPQNLWFGGIMMSLLIVSSLYFVYLETDDKGTKTILELLATVAGVTAVSVIGIWIYLDHQLAKRLRKAGAKYTHGTLESLSMRVSRCISPRDGKVYWCFWRLDTMGMTDSRLMFYGCVGSSSREVATELFEGAFYDTLSGPPRNQPVLVAEGEASHPETIRMATQFRERIQQVLAAAKAANPSALMGLGGAGFISAT